MYENDERWLSHKYYVSYMIMQSNMTMTMCVIKTERWKLHGNISRNGYGNVIRPICIMISYCYLLYFWSLFHLMIQFLCLFSLNLQDLHEEGECRQLEFWTWNSHIRDTYSTELQLTWNFTKIFCWVYKKYWRKEISEGTHQLPTRQQGTAPLGTPWCLVGPTAGVWPPPSAI
jgi:hypothetical protein